MYAEGTLALMQMAKVSVAVDVRVIVDIGVEAELLFGPVYFGQKEATNVTL
jgi:hypothetical protein